MKIDKTDQNLIKKHMIVDLKSKIKNHTHTSRLVVAGNVSSWEDDGCLPVVSTNVRDYTVGPPV
ncbi:hypothetical protein T06_10325 [Trichinella sp. T6]|nr:hypothetical protein T06_10325 [Trichinella sp. T6]